MQINRLFEIIYILMNKKGITAKALADKFEVSVRTIYRDIEILSQTGIPIYTNKGRGGGIKLLENFVLNKSLISESEQNEILTSLQSLSAIKYPDAQPILDKLGTLFNKNITNWIDVDFSSWSGGINEYECFENIKTAILESRIITFYYHNAQGEKAYRIVEPVKLIFKGQAWYFYGYCTVKKDYRFFKITRVKELNITEEVFCRDIPDNLFDYKDTIYTAIKERLILKVDKSMAYRVYDEADEKHITIIQDGNFLIEIDIVDEKSVYQYILSYGDTVEVLAPPHIRENIAKTLKRALEKYN